MKNKRFKMSLTTRQAWTGRLFTLPPDVRVYPGHGDSTTIGAEAR